MEGLKEITRMGWTMLARSTENSDLLLICCNGTWQNFCPRRELSDLCPYSPHPEAHQFSYSPGVPFGAVAPMPRESEAVHASSSTIGMPGPLSLRCSCCWFLYPNITDTAVSALVPWIEEPSVVLGCLALQGQLCSLDIPLDTSSPHRGCGISPFCPSY